MNQRQATMDELESRGVLKQNKNSCKHCKSVTLPEPIVWAKMCELTGDHVCNPCYVASLYSIIEMEGARA